MEIIMNINNLINDIKLEENIKTYGLVTEKYSKYFSEYELDEIKKYLDRWNEIMNEAHNSSCWGDGVSITEHIEAYRDFFESKENLRNELNRESMKKLKRIISWIDHDDIMTITFFKKYINEKEVERPYIMSSALIAHDFQNEIIEIYDYYNQKMDNLKKKIQERDDLTNGDNQLVRMEHERFIQEKNWLKHEENVYIYLMMRDMRDITCPLSGATISLT